MSDRADAVRRAISVVAAQQVQVNEDSTGLVYETTRDLMIEDAEAGLEGRLVVGLSTLAGLLAVLYGQETGQSVEEVLQFVSTLVEYDR